MLGSVTYAHGENDAETCLDPGMSSTAAPCALIWTVFAGAVELGAMIVALSPPAAA